MTKQIKFEGKIHAFPDDVTDEEINNALGGTPSIPSIGKDIQESFASFPQYAENIIKQSPSEISGAYHMPVTRSLKNIGQGIENLIELPINLGSKASKYIEKKDIPYISKLAGYYPEIPKHDLFNLGEEQPGDVLWQSAVPGGMIGKATSGLKGLSGLASRSGAAGTYGASQGDNPIHAALLTGLLESAIKTPLVTKQAIEKTPQIISKAGDIAPLLKSISSKPYKQQMKILEEKGLLTGYKPLTNDILEASRILKSEGMKFPHEAVDIATAEALEGNYKPWFNLQSSVRSEGMRNLKKGGVHHGYGEKLYDLAERMHQELEKQQSERGAHEAAEKMRQGKIRTARYHKISPYARTVGGLTAAATLPGWVSKLINSGRK